MPLGRASNVRFNSYLKVCNIGVSGIRVFVILIVLVILILLMPVLI